MAEHIPVPVKAAKEVAYRYRKSVVVIISYDAESQMLHTTTFGKEPVDKEVAAKWGDLFARATGSDVSQAKWYEDFRATEAAEYKARIDELEKELAARLKEQR